MATTATLSTHRIYASSLPSPNYRQSLLKQSCIIFDSNSLSTVTHIALYGSNVNDNTIITIMSAMVNTGPSLCSAPSQSHKLCHFQCDIAHPSQQSQRMLKPPCSLPWQLVSTTTTMTSGMTATTIHYATSTYIKNTAIATQKILYPYPTTTPLAT